MAYTSSDTNSVNFHQYGKGTKVAYAISTTKVSSGVKISLAINSLNNPIPETEDTGGKFPEFNITVNVIE